MAEELTPRENTWLVLKYGTDYAVKLYQRSRHGERFTGAEYRAAVLGKQISEEIEEEVVAEMCARIKEEIDQELINEISRSIK